MDSVTQIALGATIAAVCVPKEERRKAAFMGAALGTLPDLDILIDYGDAVSNFTLHRGFSHSLLTLIPFAVALWLFLKKFTNFVKEKPKPWFFAIFLPLVTHSLLDAHTAYGTQLLWPIDVTPTMWGTLFIIDPIYTLPLLISTLVVLFVPTKKQTRPFIFSGLILSTIYLGWSWIAKFYIDAQVKKALSEMGEKKVFITPTPFNTIVWRIVVVDGDKYMEGYYHFLGDNKIQFTQHNVNQHLFSEGKDVSAVAQLRWFSDDFSKAEIIEDSLVITDLRMGFEDYYIFRFRVADRINNNWSEIKATQLPAAFNFENDADVLYEILTAN